MGNSDKFEQQNICKTALLVVMLLINYVLHLEFIHLTVCTRIEARTDFTVAKVIARIFIDLN